MSQLPRIGLFSRIGLSVVLLVLAASCADEPADQPRRGEPEVPVPADSSDVPEKDSPEDAADARQTSDLSGPQPDMLSREEIAAGWISLFDGETLFGWEPSGGAEGPNWRVEEGTIAADGGEPGLLLTPVRFADYELRCEFRLEEGGNSGLFLRTTRDPQDPAVDCYELNICDTHPEFPTGSLVGRKTVEEPVEGEGEWKEFRVRVEGRQIVARMDERIVIDFVDDSEQARRTGYIGLQKNEGRIEFRKVLLRPVGTTPRFTGDDLLGWREVPGSQARFEVADGAIHVTGGPGFLESDEGWADFVFQFEARTNAADANSGVFFRAMPGTEANPSNGYELQICNSIADGDRTRPNDYGEGFGTGAIMHRSPARYVVPDDKQWFTVTLVADGPRMATWVDGYPVTVWVDEREPDENPRRGRRLKPGLISLQGHDEGTDVSFRRLRIARVLKRLGGR